MESPKGNSPEGLKGLSTPALIDALCEAQKIEPELQTRGLAFLRDVLSKVDDFPTAQLDDCTVRVVLDQGVLVINVPMYGVGVVDGQESDIAANHQRKLGIRDRLSSLHGVARVDVDGSMNSGMLSLDVVLKSDRVPAQGQSQAVEQVRGDVGESVRAV